MSKWEYDRTDRRSIICHHFAIRAREFLAYLEELSGFTLRDVVTLCDDTRLRLALHLDVNRCWKSKGALVTKIIHPEWKPGDINLGMCSKYGRSLVHGEACGDESVHICNAFAREWVETSHYGVL